MDDDQPQPARPLPFWPWLVVVMALAGCAAVDGLFTSRGSYGWGCLVPGGEVLLLLSLAIYAICAFRSLRVYGRLIRVPGRNPVPSVALAAGFAPLLLILGLTACSSATMQCSSWHCQDHWLSLTIVVAVAAVFELAGRSRAFTTPRLRFSLRWLLAATLVVSALAGLLRFMAVRRSRQQQTRINQSLRSELSQLNAALERYHEEYGDWPPAGPDRFDAHARRVFPETRNLRAILASLRLDPQTLDADEALVYWLRGLPGPSFPVHPRSVGFFEFDGRRLVDTDGDRWLEYQSPDLCDGTPSKAYRLEGKVVVAVEYAGSGAERVPVRVYRPGDDGLEVSTPSQDDLARPP